MAVEILEIIGSCLDALQGPIQMLYLTAARSRISFSAVLTALMYLNIRVNTTSAVERAPTIPSGSAIVGVVWGKGKPEGCRSVRNQGN